MNKSKSVLNILQVYFIPLLVILICYGSILISISLKTRTSKNDGLCYSWNKTDASSNEKKKSTISKNSLTPNKLVVRNYSCSVVKKSNGTVCDSTLRRTGGGDSFQRAKNRTLKMTIVLVLAFLLCWTPYTVAMFIHFLHSSSTHRPIPPLLSKFLYAFAVFNSALSPYLYGYFSFNIREELKLLLYCCSKPACFTSTGSGSPHSSQSAISIRDRRRFAVRQKTPELSSISSTMVNTQIMPNNSKEPYKSSGNSMSQPKSRFTQQQQRVSSISLKHHHYSAKPSSHQSAGQRGKNLSFQLDAPRDYLPSPLTICESEACVNRSTGKIDQVGEQTLEANGSHSSAARCSLTDEESCLQRISGEPVGCTQSQSLLLLTDDDGDNYSNTSSNAGPRSQSFTVINNNNNMEDEEEEEQDLNGDGSSGAAGSTAKQPLLLSPKVGIYRNAKWKHANKLQETEKKAIGKEEPK